MNLIKVIIQYKERFDEIRHEENGIEFWYAREIMELLEYAQWRNFEKTIEKTKISCENNGITVTDYSSLSFLLILSRTFLSAFI